MVNDFNRSIETQCTAAGMYPAFPRASQKSLGTLQADNGQVTIVTDSFLADQLRITTNLQQSKSRPTVFKIDAPPILTQSIRKGSMRRPSREKPAYGSDSIDNSPAKQEENLFTI